MDKNITTDAKINYIFETMQKQEKRYKWGMFFKWGFRILILVYIYIFFIYMLPSIMDSFTKNIIPSFGGDQGQEMNMDQLYDIARQYFNQK